MAVIATHSEAESYLSLLMVSLFGAKPAAGAAIFNLLKANHLQMKAITSVAAVVLGKESTEMLKPVLKVFEESAENRNTLAHCMWGLDESILDGVVLARSNVAARFSVEVLHAAGQKNAKDRIKKASSSMNDELQIWRECHFQNALSKANKASSIMQNSYFEVLKGTLARSR
ncbi:hypothetical protein V5F89_07500 [Pelagerythrobacter marensis]|uniref:Uncharacterized protein n=1 Tax=Pelagerythrobacter marensis TaxID=543877 RepID=A0ABZ2CZB4_9SPHN